MRNKLAIPPGWRRGTDGANRCCPKCGDLMRPGDPIVVRFASRRKVSWHEDCVVSAMSYQQAVEQQRRHRNERRRLRRKELHHAR